MNLLSRTLFVLTLIIGLFFTSFALTDSVFATNELPFEDVSPADNYYDDLLSLYKRGIIPMSPDKKFNPSAKMDRDVFVSIVVGVSCKNCLIPSFDDIIKYTQKPFADFEKRNESFYCVSYAKELGIIKGYTLDTTGKTRCSDGSVQTEVPFCAKNEITRIEAAAVLLRQGGLWNESKNNASFKKEINLPDVDDTWYGYAQKAVQTGLITQGDDSIIKPNEYITKAEFIRMAAKIFRTNICSVRQGPANSTSSQVPVDSNSSPNTLSSQSVESMLSSQLTVLPDGAKCVSGAIPTTTVISGMKRTLCTTTQGTNGPFSYNWEMIRTGDTNRLTASGAYLEPFTFTGTGTWIVRVTVTDLLGLQSQSSATVFIDGPNSNTNTGLSLQIRASTLAPDLLAPVNFSSIVQGGKGPFIYRWDFGDGNFSSEPNPMHPYAIPGSKTVQLVVRDSNGNTSIAQLVLVVEGDDDLDNDGIKNTLDLCPFVHAGEDGISGCPRISPYDPKLLNIDGSGSTDIAYIKPFDTPGFFGTIEVSTKGTNGMCHFLRARESGAIFGRRQCTACPCPIELDYVAQMRSCDIVFPAILSPDKKSTYSRGKVFEIQ